MNFAAEMSQNEQFPPIAEIIFSRLFDLYGVLDDTGRVIEIAGPIFQNNECRTKTASQPGFFRNGLLAIFRNKFVSSFLGCSKSSERQLFRDRRRVPCIFQAKNTT